MTRTGHARARHSIGPTVVTRRQEGDCAKGSYRDMEEEIIGSALEYESRSGPLFGRKIGRVERTVELKMRTIRGLLRDHIEGAPPSSNEPAASGDCCKVPSGN